MTLAYLDPGSGSLIASVLVGGAAAAGVAAKQARMKLGGLGRKKKRADEQATPSVAEEAPAAGAADDAVEERPTVRSDT